MAWSDLPGAGSVMRKRSSYRPKGVRLDTMAWVKSGLMVVSDVPQAGINLKIKNHAALASITQGKAVRDDIDVLIAAMNVAEALGRLNHGSDWLPEIKQAQDAVVSMSRRGIEKGDKFLFTGSELTAVNLAMEVHDTQLDTCTVILLEQSLQLVEREIRNKRARPIMQ